MIRALVVAALVATGAAASEPLDEGWYATIETSRGSIVVRLLPDQAPQTVAHFAAFADGRMTWTDPISGEPVSGRYYDGVPIHLAEALERFEAGDRTGTGRGAPEVYVPPETRNPITFDRPGRVGMTRATFGRVSGVVFFVSASPLPHLIGRHPCFGEVVSGMDTVRSICGVKTDSVGHPLEPILIETIRIAAVGDPPPLPAPEPYEPELRRFGPKSRKP